MILFISGMIPILYTKQNITKPKQMYEAKQNWKKLAESHILLNWGKSRQNLTTPWSCSLLKTEPVGWHEEWPFTFLDYRLLLLSDGKRPWSTPHSQVWKTFLEKADELNPDIFLKCSCEFHCWHLRKHILISFLEDKRWLTQTFFTVFSAPIWFCLSNARDCQNCRISGFLGLFTFFSA